MHTFLDNFGRDLRYTGRSLCRQPLLVTAAALSIGVAVAANAVIFGLANDLLLSAPSTRQPDQLAYIRMANGSHVSYPQWKELDGSGALAGIAGYQIEIEVNWTGPEQSISMLPLIVTPNFFDLLGVPIAQGRAFTTAEALPERQAGVAVISHAFWQNRLGSDPSAVGRILTFNGQPYTVLGILPAGLRAVPGLGIAPEVYLPISRDLLPEIDRRDSSAVMLIGRMRPDQPLEQGRAALQAVVQRLDKERGADELGGVRQFAGGGRPPADRCVRRAGGVLCHPWGRGRARAGDRLCERRGPAVVARGWTGPRGRTAFGTWRKPVAAGAAAADRGRLARTVRHGDRDSSVRGDEHAAHAHPAAVAAANRTACRRGRPPADAVSRHARRGHAAERTAPRGAADPSLAASRDQG